MSFRRDWYILTGLHVTVFIGCAKMMPPPTSERGTAHICLSTAPSCFRSCAGVTKTSTNTKRRIKYLVNDYLGGMMPNVNGTQSKQQSFAKVQPNLQAIGWQGVSPTPPSSPQVLTIVEHLSPSQTLPDREGLIPVRNDKILSFRRKFINILY